MGTRPTAPVLHSARTQGRVNLTTVGEVYHMMGAEVKWTQNGGLWLAEQNGGGDPGC